MNLYSPYREPLLEVRIERVLPDGSTEVLVGHTYQCFAHGAGLGTHCKECVRESQTATAQTGELFVDGATG
jgi:hypothetical protein